MQCRCKLVGQPYKWGAIERQRSETLGMTQPGKSASVAVGLLGGRNNFLPIIKRAATIQDQASATKTQKGRTCLFKNHEEVHSGISWLSIKMTMQSFRNRSESELRIHLINVDGVI